MQPLIRQSFYKSLVNGSHIGNIVRRTISTSKMVQIKVWISIIFFLLRMIDDCDYYIMKLNVFIIDSLILWCVDCGLLLKYKKLFSVYLPLICVHKIFVSHCGQEGDKIPSFDLFEDSPANKVNIAELCAGKKVVIFAVPGAFTPGCSKVNIIITVTVSMNLLAIFHRNSDPSTRLLGTIWCIEIQRRIWDNLHFC